jgi:hypothetical protein
LVGGDCEMKNVCNPKRAKCPLICDYQSELDFGEIG